MDCADKCSKATGIVERALESGFNYLIPVIALPTTTWWTWPRSLPLRASISLSLKGARCFKIPSFKMELIWWFFPRINGTQKPPKGGRWWGEVAAAERQAWARCSHMALPHSSCWPWCSFLFVVAGSTPRCCCHEGVNDDHGSIQVRACGRQWRWGLPNTHTWYRAWHC